MSKDYFVLESFNDFWMSQYKRIDEGGKESTLTVEDIREFMDDLVEKQKDLLDEAGGKSRKELISKLSGISDADDKRQAILEYIDKKEKQPEYGRGYLKEHPTKLRSEARLFSAFLWDDIPDAEKEELAQNLLAEAIKKGYKDRGALMKLINKKDTLSGLPYIGVLPEEIEQKLPEKPKTKDVEFAVMDEDSEQNAFKPNMFAADTDSFRDPEFYGELKKRLMEVVSPDFIIENVVIMVSSDRYRNTSKNFGDEELSFGELSYKRARALHKILIEVAQEIEMPEDKIRELERTGPGQKVFLHYFGQNGDGTSGPNPPEPNSFGSYNEDSKFVEGKDRNEITYWELGERGVPVKEIETTINKDFPEPLDRPEDYAQFRCANIYVKGKKLSMPIRDTEEDPNPVALFGRDLLMGGIPGEDGKPRKPIRFEPMAPKQKGRIRVRGKVPNGCPSF